MVKAFGCRQAPTSYETEDYAMNKGYTERRVTRFVSSVAFGGFLLVLMPSVTLARDLPRARCELVPDSWTPSLDQVRESVEESATAEAQTSQQSLNQTSQNLADLRDAQLFIDYVQLMQTLDVRGQTDLFEEQKRWLSKRAEKARASVVSKGGTLKPLEYSDSFRKITEERLAELEKRLHQRTNPRQ